MAEASSEKDPQSGVATPRLSSSEATVTVHGSPASRDDEVTLEGTEKKAGYKPADEKAALNKAADDESNDSHVDLGKLDSQAPNCVREKDADPYAALAPEEAAILKRQVETPDIKVGIVSLYRYATRIDLILIFIGAVCAIASGAILPLMTVVFGSLQGTFAGYFNKTVSYDDFMDEMTHLVLYFVYLGIGMFFTTYVSTVVFIYTGEHIAGKVRERYLESCLKQNIVSSPMP